MRYVCHLGVEKINIQHLFVPWNHSARQKDVLMCYWTIGICPLICDCTKRMKRRQSEIYLLLSKTRFEHTLEWRGIWGAMTLMRPPWEIVSAFTWCLFVPCLTRVQSLINSSQIVIMDCGQANSMLCIFVHFFYLNYIRLLPSNL